MCRYCNIPFQETDNPYYKYTYIKQDSIAKLVRQNNRTKLRSMAYYNIDNATHKLKYCDPERGIHGACPWETVHTVQLGWIIYCLNAFFKQKKVPAKERRKNSSWKARKMIDNKSTTGSVYEPPDESNVTNLNIFCPSFLPRFEARAKQIGQLLQQQSNRDLPRTHFPQGIIPSDECKKKNKKNCCT